MRLQSPVGAARGDMGGHPCTPALLRNLSPPLPGAGIALTPVSPPQVALVALVSWGLGLQGGSRAGAQHLFNSSSRG